jgi:hypothetical protein
MSKTQSKQLTQFYQAYSAWLKQGAPVEDGVFTRNRGLCHSLWAYFRSVGLLAQAIVGIDDEMTLQFENADLSSTFPFNETSSSYHQETETGTIHINAARRAWVQLHAY